MQTRIFTPRLELRAGSSEIFSIPFHDRQALAAALRVHVPDDWPVEHYDADPLTHCKAALDLDADAAPWQLRYLIERSSNTLVGFGGSGDRPAAGIWTIGYSVLPQYRRKGYASECVAALIDAAFAHDDIRCVAAETYPELVASIGVLRKNGFTLAGPGEGDRVIRFERWK
jgi:RimJ/RimL family protein N-acetyltransferase